MEGLDLDNILDEHDFDKFITVENNTSEPFDGDEDDDKKETTEVDPDELFDGEPESVGSEDVKEKEDINVDKATGSSPNFYSSIAEAFITDDIFPDLDEEKAKNIKNAEDFKQVFKEYVESSLSEQERRIKEALELDADTQAIRQFEGNIAYLNSITDDILRAENEQSEDLRKRLIYQDFINRGFSKERAEKEVNKSIDNGNDIEDADDALNSLKKFYNDSYKNYVEQLRQRDEEAKKQLAKRNEDFKKAVFDPKSKIFDGFDLDKGTRQKIYDAITKPVYKDKETGEVLNALQKYSRQNEDDFILKLGFIYTMTDGFKSLDKLINTKAKKEYKKSIKDLEGRLNTTSRNSDGNLEFVSGTDGELTFGKGIKLAF